MIPDQVKIGPYIYTVILEEKVRGDKNQDLYGEIKYGPATIRIQSGLLPPRTLAILLHECLHGIDEYMNIGLTEKQISRLGSGLAAFLLDNNLMVMAAEDMHAADA